MSLRDRLIRLLADGQFHSGNDMARALGVSRSAVWKQIHQLNTLGLEIETASRRGYRLSSPLDLLDASTITNALDPQAREASDGVEVLFVTSSTNTMLASREAPAAGRWRAVFAEYQTDGRGRRGRRWISPFGTGLCFSLSWLFSRAPRDLPALSLAAGLAVIRPLEATGAQELALKWPNDILIAGDKLGGVLVDVDGDARGPLRVIIGIGINLSAPQALVRAVTAEGGLSPGALEGAPGGASLERSRLAAEMIGSLYRALERFQRDGFAPLADDWRRRDYLFGKPVVVRSGTDEKCGIGCGIAPDGALLIERPEGIAAVFNGEVTVRVRE